MSKELVHGFPFPTVVINTVLTAGPITGGKKATVCCQSVASIFLACSVVWIQQADVGNTMRWGIQYLDIQMTSMNMSTNRPAG